MTEFGQPRRSATQDANAGVINPPAQRVAARTVATPAKKEQPTQLGTAIESTGAKLGAALQSYLTEETTNINERKATAAAIRQGQATSINSVDATKERTGWTRAIFGQDVEYREAQQRAATNSVQQLYIEQAAKVGEFKGETPAEYEQRLIAGLDTVLEPYQDDQETKSMITLKFMEASAKLANKHYAEHYAYNQQQQRETYEKEVQQTFDTWTVDQTQLKDVTEAEAQLDRVYSFFNGHSKPAGMSPEAWRGSVNNQLDVALRNGNIGAYKMAQLSGWTDKLLPAERLKLDKAISVYDTQFFQKVNRQYEQAELAALDAANADEAAAIYAEFRSSLGIDYQKASGSARSMSALARSDFNDVIGQRESNGNYQAENQLGYIGKYQFGGMALESTGYKKDGKWTGKDGVNSADDWKNNPDAQESAMATLTGQNRRHLTSRGVMDKVGETFNGVRVTEQGLLAASHLVGAEAVARMLESGTVPADANGTTALSYMSMFQNPTTDVNQEVANELTEDMYASGSERGAQVLAQHASRAEKAAQALQKTTRTLGEKAIKAALKKEAELKRLNALKDAHRDPDAVSRGSKLSGLNPTKAEAEETLDMVLVDEISTQLGLEKPLTMTEAAQVMMTDVSIANRIANIVKDKQTDSPMVDRMIETFIGGFGTHIDENNQLTESGKTALAAIAQFEKNEAWFKGMIGSKYDHLEIIKRGVYMQHTADMIQKDIDLFEKNKGNKEQYGINWELGENESKRDRIQGLVNRFGGGTPYGSSLAHYMEEFDRGLILYQGDRKRAETYLRKSVMNSGLSYRGKAIIGGRKLNEVTKYPFEQLLDSAQESVGNGASMLTPKLASMGVALEGEDGKILTSIEQVEDLEFYTVDGVDGFYMTSPWTQADAFVSHSDMAHWAKQIQQRDNFSRMKQEAGDKVVDQWMKEQETLQKYAPIGAGFF
jgi:hypothetical protein